MICINPLCSYLPEQKNGGMENSGKAEFDGLKDVSILNIISVHSLYYDVCSAEAMRAYPEVLNRSPNDIENTIYQKAKVEVSA